MTGERRDQAAAAALLVLWSVAVIALRWNAWAPDLSAVMIAAWLWQHDGGSLIYAMPTGFFGGIAPEWASAMSAMGFAGRESYPYLYPPLWAALLAPLTQTWSVQALMNAALVAQVPLLAGSVMLAGRLARPAGMRRAIWALWGVGVLSLSVPAYHALYHLQPSILMGFVILLAFERLAAGRQAAFGALVALAAAIKLTPAVFVVAALPLRARRGVAAFALAGAALALLSIGLAGWAPHAEMLASLRAVAGQSLMIAVNLSLESVIAQALLRPALLPAAAATPVALGAGMAVLALLAVAVLVWRARSWPMAERPLGTLMALSLILGLLGPLGWLHYFTLPALLLPGLARLMPPRRAWLAGGLAVAASVMPVYLLLARLPAFHAVYPALAATAWLAVLTALLWPAARG